LFSFDIEGSPGTIVILLVTDRYLHHNTHLYLFFYPSSIFILFNDPPSGARI